MKRYIKMIVLLISIIFTLCSCMEKSQKEDKEKVFLVRTSDSYIEDMDFEKTEKYGIYTSEYQQELNVKKSRKIIDDKKQSVEYKYTLCKKKDDSSHKMGEFYSAYDVYQSNDIQVKYLHDSDLMCFYFNFESNMVDSASEINRVQAKEIADRFLLEIVGIEKIEKYTCEDILIDPLDRYMLPYVRYIDGCRTDEVLCVWVDKAGNVRVYNGYNLNKYDSLLNVISSEKVDEAKLAIEKKVKECEFEKIEFNDVQLVTNTSGDVYLEYYIKYSDIAGKEYINSVLTIIE